jgi:3-methyl-2-oxobutanoate hydroxymethyltransferase
MAEMLLFTAAVMRGAGEVPVVGDMPFGAYSDVATALKNAQAFTALGVRAVKLEGDKPDIIQALVAGGIQVVGHLGVLPQTAKSFKKVGKNPLDSERLKQEAVSVEAAGACALVLENIDAETATAITQKLGIPTIGIGAGSGTDGQVQVMHDLLGLGDRRPPFAQVFAELGEAAVKATKAYAAKVRGGWTEQETVKKLPLLPDTEISKFYN